MRRTRWLILLVLTVLVAAVAVIYTTQKAAQARSTPAPPKSLPPSLAAEASDWTYEKTADGRPLVRARARKFQQSADGKHIDLAHVELHMFKKDGNGFDRFRSAKANFDLERDILYSEGDVEITTGLRENGPPAQSVTIRTSGLHFESKSGKAWTDRPASFQFAKGQGQSRGAAYDPATGEMQMHHDVKLHWQGSNPKAPPMDIEAGSLLYKEATSEIFLNEWSKFRRETLAMEGGHALVKLKDEAISNVDAFTAKGVDIRPDRRVEYAADLLHIRFNDDGVMQGITGENNAKLVSNSGVAVTTVTSKQIEMQFATAGNDSILETAKGTGDAVIESRPVIRPKVAPADTRVVRSNVVMLKMKPGGKDIDRVDTGAPGTAEFIPNRAGGKKRTVDGAVMNVVYGSENQVRQFDAVDVATRTDAPPVKGKTPPPSLTWSKNMRAHFDEKSGEMTHLEQWENFRYEEGDRRAKSDRADLYQPAEDIVLTGSARVWDPSGTTAAEKIIIHQKTSVMEAIGSVSSTREPEQKKAKPDAPTPLMSGDQPVQARAARMTSAEDNTLITYEGDALLWQGSNRITADTIRIDRKNSRLQATGNVVSQLLDKSEAKQKRTVFTVVRAPRMDYDDKTRLAHYTGGAKLDRAGTTVTAAEIRAWLKSGEAGDSSLDRAFADGNVKILQNAPTRTRTGQSEHSEYYADDGRVILSGGKPEFADSLKGVTRGQKITYFQAEDRMVVEGEEKKPVETKMLRRRK